MTKKIWTEERVKQLIMLYDLGLSYQKIADSMGLTKATVGNALVRMKITITRREKGLTHTDEDKQFLNALCFTKDAAKLQKLMGNINCYRLKELARRHKVLDKLTNCYWNNTAETLSNKDARRF